MGIRYFFLLTLYFFDHATIQLHGRILIIFFEKLLVA